RIAGSGGPPWAVLMAVRVPPGSGEAWLCEWRTNGGTWSRWSLKITSGGALQVVASDSDASPETVTYTSTLGVADGRWHVVSVWAHHVLEVIIRLDSAEEEFSTPGATAGAIRAFRPRPVFADPTDKSPIGLGHAFVLVDPGTSWIPEDRRRHIPVDGWAGEPAADRFERLAVEEGIPYRLVMPVLARDQFDRTVPVGGGPADLGGAWETLVDAFIESQGEGVISPSVGGHAHQSGVTVTDVDMRASVMASDQFALSALTVRDGPDYTYTVELWQSGGTVIVEIWRLLDGQWENLSWIALGSEIEPGQRWWIRAQARGDRIRGKAWLVGEPEPDWQVEAHDRAISSGLVGVTSESLNGSVTFRWRDIT